ncbi:hypothetical protein ACVMAJ_005562 [Bradyrhizobium sp. USDA 4448]
MLYLFSVFVAAAAIGLSVVVIAPTLWVWVEEA